MKEKLNYRKHALYHITKVLWHLDIFRRSFRELSGHACMAESCIFCALKELFGQLQFSQESALPPDALRRALAESFFDQQRFQLGLMDDAAECFENILLRIHYHIASGEVEDMCNARHCIPHQKFAMTLVEQSVCEACHVTSEPLSYTQMVHYVSASALTTQARQVGKSAHLDFGQLLRKAGGMGDIRDCPSSCGAKIQICRALMNRPEIVSVGVVWDSERPTLQHIMAVFATIGTSLRLSDVFHSVMDHRWAATTTHALVGVVTYYGKHYSTFFFHTKLRVWIYFDDATVREIGPRFDQVVDKCRRGRYQPLLLLYAVQGGTPVATDGAPKTIVHVPLTAKTRPAVKTPPSPSLSVPLTPTLPLRRSVTPSPEKTQSAPNSAAPRRAITPNPDVAHHRTISRSYSDYQNLTDIQASIFNGADFEPGYAGRKAVDAEPSYISRKAVESVLTYQKQNPVQRTNSVYAKEADKKASLQRSYSNEIEMPEHFNIPRRRDSGNWSGDRNSASSSSSMENPYLYLVGKLQARNPGVPRSPTSTKPPGEVFLDPGYDSYSLSSNDSLPLQQGLKHNLQLAQIPEHHPPSQTCVYPARLSGDECEHLCLEADQLLDKSKQLEEARDLETALVLCQAAAGKARAAMDAPYNNPQTLTFARMKHNTCVMRVRSLHRRLLQAQAEALGEVGKEDGPKISHSREGSGSSNRSGGHSRQGSRDRTSPAQHSRQSSRELANQLPVLTTEKPTKNIEIYATLPKKKLGGSLRGGKPKSEPVEDEEYMYERPGRSLHSRGARKKEEERNMKEKRARSEERNKSTREYLLGNVSLTLPKDSPGNKKESPSKKDKAKEEKEKTTGEGKGKKQHKIRRKLLLGGLIRRKNRSMPDLREGTGVVAEGPDASAETKSSQDDSILGIKGAETSTLSGYLSEGHLEYTGGVNQNMERSRLMRKSFHGSAGKVLTAAKVPPPPPLRTTSQLTAKDSERPPYPLPNNPILQRLASSVHNPAVNEALFEAYSNYNHSLPYEPVTYANGGVLLQNAQRNYNETFSNEGSLQNLALPPYPSPPGSVSHSRQASEDFPLPPPPLEHLLGTNQHSPTPSLVATAQECPNGLLAQLQQKRQQILEKEGGKREADGQGAKQKSGEEWLRELQAKQAERKLKKGAGGGAHAARGGVNGPEATKESLSSVKDLASRFENIRVLTAPKQEAETPKNATQTVPGPVEHSSCATGGHEAGPNRVPEVPLDIRVEQDSVDGRRRTGKKKNVTFCDQVILVATAEDEEDDSFIPNPILERVLRSAFKHEGETAKITTVPLMKPAEHPPRQSASLNSSFEAPQDPPNQYQPPQSYRLDRQLQEAYTNSNLRPVSYQQNTQPSQTPPNNYYQAGGAQTQSTPPQANYYPTSTQALTAPQFYQQNSQTQPLQNPPQPQPNYYQQTTPPTQNPPQSQANYYQQTTPPAQNPSQPQPNYYQQTTPPNQNPPQSQPNYYQQTTQPTQNPPQPQPQPNYYQQTALQSQIPPQPQPIYYHQSTPLTQNPPQPQNNYYQQNSQPQPVQNPSQPPANYYHQNGQPQPAQNPPQPQPNYYQPPQSYPATSVPQRQQYQEYQQQVNAHQQHSAFANHQSLSTSAQPVYQRVPHPSGIQERTGHPETVQRSTSSLETIHRAASHPEMMIHRQTTVGERSNGQEAGQRQASNVPRGTGQRQGAAPLVYPPYQHPPPPRQAGAARPVYQPLPEDAVRASPCHLCRKKPVAPPAVYCTDCHFYMSRFKPRTQ